jgi:hypothetical protein
MIFRYQKLDPSNDTYEEVFRFFTLIINLMTEYQCYTINQTKYYFDLKGFTVNYFKYFYGFIEIASKIKPAQVRN